MSDWRQWLVPGTIDDAFFPTGVSSSSFDQYALDPLDTDTCYEIRIRGGTTALLVAISDRPDEAVASTPVPETVEQLIDWARMCAAVDGSSPDSNPFW